MSMYISNKVSKQKKLNQSVSQSTDGIDVVYSNCIFYLCIACNVVYCVYLLDRLSRDC